MRLYWQDTIPYEVVNPSVNADWSYPEEAPVNCSQQTDIAAKLRQIMVGLVRLMFSQNRRNKDIDLLSYLICPNCGSSSLVKDIGQSCLFCNGCQISYPLKDGIPFMFPVDNKGRQ